MFILTPVFSYREPFIEHPSEQEKKSHLGTAPHRSENTTPYFGRDILYFRLLERYGGLWIAG